MPSSNSARSNAMEEVLALQSYLPGMGGVEACISDRSIEVICPSYYSSVGAAAVGL